MLGSVEGHGARGVSGAIIGSADSDVTNVTPTHRIVHV